MQTIKEAATEFLTHRRIAVTGVSRGGVDAVVIATAPDKAEKTVRECVELGIRYVWMHRAYGQGSVSDDAAAYGRQHGLTVIAGGCPLMFGPTADVPHRIMRVFCGRHIPKVVEDRH